VNGFLTHTPLWQLLAGTLLLFLLAALSGYALGQHRQRPDRRFEGQLGPTLGGLIGLLGLLIAFTFGMASARFDLRRVLQVEQANTLGVAYLRAELIPESLRGEARDLLRQDVDVLLTADSPERTAEAITGAQRIQESLWTLAVRAVRESPTVITGLFVQAVNQIIDSQARRIELGWNNPLPPTILGTLYLVCTIVLFVMGFENGLTGGGRPVASMVMVFTLTTVVLLIVDLDRPQQGLLRNGQRPLLDVRALMTKP